MQIEYRGKKYVVLTLDEAEKKITGKVGKLVIMDASATGVGFVGQYFVMPAKEGR